MEYAIYLCDRLTHPYAVKFAEENGFNLLLKYDRKYYGQAPKSDYTKWTYGVTSLGFCGY